MGNKILFEDVNLQLRYEKLRDNLVEYYKSNSSKVLVKPLYFTMENGSLDEFMLTLIYENKGVPYSFKDVTDLLSIVSVPDFKEFGIEEDECSEVIIFED